MSRTVKVFTDATRRRDLESRYPVVEHYRGFVLLEVPASDLARLSRRFLVEDITPQYTVRVVDRVVGTSSRRRAVRSGGRRPARVRVGTGERLGPGRHHYLVEFIGPIKQAWLAEVRRAGAEPRVPYQNFTYVVRADGQTLRRIASLRFVRGVSHLPFWARIATAIRKKKSLDAPPALPRTQVRPGSYAVEFFDAEDARRALRSVRGLGLRILSSQDGSRIVVVRADPRPPVRRRQIERLSAVHGVRSIRERIIKRTANDVAARLMGTNRTLSRSGLDLSGKGEIVAVCDTGLDTGDPETIHPDFRNRIVDITSYPMTDDFDEDVSNPGADDGPADRDDGHGTHVAGSVLGNGKASRGLDGRRSLVRGLAPRAKLFFQAVEQEVEWLNPADVEEYGRFVLAGIPHDLTRLFAEAYRKGARIHSNSWGGGDPGAYDSQCEQLDQFVWKHADFCVVCAAGNDAEDKDGDGKIVEMSVSSPATAKNCISVGACENRRPEFDSQTYGGPNWWPKDYPVAPFKRDPMADDPDQVVAFSSRGPTLDQRIKPDVVAPGTFILSTRSTQISRSETGWAKFPPSRLYFHMGGTSMATPLVAGAAALVREYLRRKRRIANPSAALIRAALIAGAERIGSASERRLVHDIHQGYGRVNMDRVLAPARPASAEFHESRRGLRTGDIWEAELEVRSSAAPLRVVLA